MARKKLVYVYKGSEVNGVWYPADTPISFTEVPDNFRDFLPDDVNKAIADGFIANFEKHANSRKAG